MNNALCMHLFSCHQGKSILKIKSHLIAKTTDSSRPGTIMFLHTSVHYMLKEIKVLLHGRKLIESDESPAVKERLWVI